MSQDRPSNGLCIELLGGFRISYASEEIRDDGWRLAKARSLVKIIALAPGHTILREQLMELLWPELDPESGSNNLHQALHVARRTLGSLIPDAKPNEILHLRRGVLSLEPPVPVWVDLLSFESLASNLAESSDPADFYRALDLYRGDLLPDDLYEDWAVERRLAAREQYIALLDRLSRLHIARQEAMPAIDALRRVVAIEPDQEEAHRTLMELYALTGRRQQALRQYERLRDILERELDLDPEPETDELYAAIQTGEFPSETWETEAPETTTQPARPEITESIADFLQRAGDFVGRSHELVTLQQALEGVMAGRGEIILVAGEPGIGKTRMTEEFLRYANAQGVRTLWGRCYEGDGAPAYWPWVQIVRSFIESRSIAELRSVMGPGAADIARIAPEVRKHIPDLEEPPQLDPDGERFRLFDSMTTFLKNAAARAPLALIIDDLHTADRSSLLLLEFLAREIAESGLIIIGTYRHVEVDRSHPLTRTLGQLARQNFTERINLDGLAPADIDRYITLITGRDAPQGLAEAIHEQTEGNPFFVREIVHLLVDEERLDNPDDVRSWRLTIPPGIRDTIALRTARLSETAHKVLTTASVSGRDFELPIVAQVAGLDELDTLDGLEEALTTGLVSESPVTAGGFRFAHAITRETLYEELSEARRMRMHLRTGEAIENFDGDTGTQVTALANHFVIAAPLGATNKAIRYLQKAGEQAESSVAHVEAAQYSDQIIELMSQDPQVNQRSLARQLLVQGQRHQNAGHGKEALESFERAAEIALELNESELYAGARLYSWETTIQEEAWTPDGIASLQDALDAVEEIDSPIKVQILTQLASEFATSQDPEVHSVARAQWASKAALEAATRLNDHSANITALMARQWFLQASDAALHDRIENGRSLLTGLSAATPPEQALLVHAFIFGDHLEAGNVEEFECHLERYRTIAESIRIPHYIWAAKIRNAMRAIMTERLDRAEDIVREAYEYGLKHSPKQHVASTYAIQMHLIHRETGRLDQVVDLIEAIAQKYPGYSYFECVWIDTLLQLNERRAAERAFEQFTRNELSLVPRNTLWLPTTALLAAICAELERPTEAKVIYELLLPRACSNVTGGGNVISLGAASFYLGLLAMMLDSPEHAADHFASAADLNLRMNARVPLAHTLHHQAVSELLMKKEGMIDRALHLNQQAHDLSEELKLNKLTERSATLTEIVKKQSREVGTE